MTGASEVMADAALGLALSQSAKGGRNPAMLVRLVRVQKIEMGKICSIGQCQSLREVWVTHPLTQTKVKAQTPTNTAQPLTTEDLYVLFASLGHRRSVQSGAGAV